MYQTSINAPRQKTQAIIKQACQKAGIEVELKSVVASVFFSSDTANPDTYSHFYCDAQMYNTTMTATRSAVLHEPVSCRGRWRPRRTSGRAATSRAGRARNMTTSTSRPSRSSMPVKRAAMYIKLNDIVVGDNYIQPVVCRPRVTACQGQPEGRISGWDNDLWQTRELVPGEVSPALKMTMRKA